MPAAAAGRSRRLAVVPCWRRPTAELGQPAATAVELAELSDAAASAAAVGLSVGSELPGAVGLTTMSTDYHHSRQPGHHCSMQEY